MSITDPPPDEEEVDAVEQARLENKIIRGHVSDKHRQSMENRGRSVDKRGKRVEKPRIKRGQAVDAGVDKRGKPVNSIQDAEKHDSTQNPHVVHEESTMVVHEDVTKSKKLDEDTVTEICHRAFVRGERPDDIAEALKLGRSTIYEYVRENREAWGGKRITSLPTEQTTVQTNAKGDGGIAPDDTRERVGEIIIERGTIIVHKVGLNPKMSLAFDWVRNNRDYQGDIGDFINHLLDFWLDACKLDIGVIKKA